MKPEISKELIFDHFASKSTPLQKRQIEEWLKTTENEELYYKWLEEWESNNAEYAPDSVAMKAQFEQFLKENTPNVAVSTDSDLVVAPKFWRNWRVAASVILIVSAGLWVMKEPILFKTRSTEYGEVKTFILADGTQVTLNANSKLKVPRWGFGRDTRTVFLEGEANFSVTKKPDGQKFKVETAKSFDIEVLGTEFSVFARARGAKVTLNEGRILLNYKEKDSTKVLLMKPGEQVLFNENAPITQKKIKPTQLKPAWQDKRFVFDETPLGEVSMMIEESYGVKVKILDKNLATRTLSGSFHAENVEELLQTLVELLEIKSSKHEGYILLESK